jgi:hypothetical protein
MGVLAAMLLLVVVSAAGCGGIKANVPISPMLFMQNQQGPPSASVLAGSELAVNNPSSSGQ